MAVIFINQSALARVQVLIIFVSTLLITLVQCKPLCELGYYYDEVTGNCDHCSDICEQAEQQGTIEKCEGMCPGYNEEREEKIHKCPPLEYYDDKVERCDSCSSVCLYHDVFGSEHLRTCMELCPDWPLPTANSSNTNGNNTSKHPIGHDDMNQTRWFGENITYITMVIGILVALVIAVLVLLLFIRRIQRKRKQTYIGSPKCNRRSQQPVQRDSHELESLTGRGDPLTQPEDKAG